MHVWLTPLRWTGRGALLFTLLLPSLLVAVDHHGAERDPTHTHVSLESEAPAEPLHLHTHGFERQHEHDVHVFAADVGAIALALAEPATAPLISASPIVTQPAIGLLGVAALFLALGDGARSYSRGLPAGVRVATGVVSAPPRRPPRPALAL